MADINDLISLIYVDWIVTGPSVSFIGFQHIHRMFSNNSITSDFHLGLYWEIDNASHNDHDENSINQHHNTYKSIEIRR